VFRCKGLVSFGVKPRDADVWVNGAHIGTAGDWNQATGGKLYRLQRAGVYTVKLARSRYRTAWVRVVVTDSAPLRTALIDLTLKPAGSK
jgi:hypothetical protein